MPWRGKRSIIHFGIAICGSEKFVRQTQASLDLLKPTSQFEIIKANIAVIRQGKRSGMKARAQAPTFSAGKRTWQHSPVWYAGAIAHDAYHAKLYRDAKTTGAGKEPGADVWTGTAAERKCLAFQRQVLLEIGADAPTIAYLEQCEENPTYQGDNRGWRSWLDYLKRWW